MISERRSPVEVECAFCKKLVKKKVSSIKESKSGRVYCSRFCSSRMNNKENSHAKPQGKCLVCNVAISKSTKRCKEHRGQRERKYSLTTTRKAAEYKVGSPSNQYVGVRMHARTLLNKLSLGIVRPLSCSICGYDKFVDLCHIKAIKDFTDDDFLGVINSSNNLTTLCPNHHREFDRGVLESSIKTIVEQYSFTL